MSAEEKCDIDRPDPVVVVDPVVVAPIDSRLLYLQQWCKYEP